MVLYASLSIGLIIIENGKFVRLETSQLFSRETTNHGGLAIFIKNYINSKPVDLMNFNLVFHAEFCGIELANNILLIAICRSVLGSFNNFIDKFESLLN